MSITMNDTYQENAGWLRSPTFDFWFIGGITIIGVLSALLVIMDPRLFIPILLLDIWILGYQHVISTFTRLCFDKKSFEENKFLVTWLPLICFAAVALIGKTAGVWALTSIYFYWQWFHYSRQSWGVSQAYRRNANGRVVDSENFSKLVLYSVPATGILYRVYQSPDVYLGFELWTPEIPFFVVAASAVVSIITVSLWVFKRFQQFIIGQLPVAHTAYMVSHIVIFTVGYILIEDVTYGWLAINIWHNAQYIMFVWLFNNKRYDKKENANASFISRLSQSENWKKYFLFCGLLSTAVYMAISSAEPLFAIVGLAPMIIIYQTINFHHYIVDSIIWKSKRKPAKA